MASIVPLTPASFIRTTEASVALEELVDFFSRHLVLPEGGAVAMGLWAMHTYIIDVLDISPFLTFTSPVKRSGKSTAVELMHCVVREPEVNSNPSTAYLFRRMEEAQPTLIIDEFDALRGNEDLRGILNAGHRRHTAYVGRCEPPDWQTKRFRVFGPKVLGLIGDLPDTIDDRSILLSFQRRKKSEYVERMPFEEAFNYLKTTREVFQAWADQNKYRFKGSLNPETPVHEFLDDRQLDNWRPLLAIAEHLGDPWAERAQDACLNLALREEEFWGNEKVLLLHHTKQVLERWSEDKIRSSDLVSLLQNFSGSPWEKKLSQWTLAKELKGFNIRPRKMRFGNSTAQGYLLQWFQDPFERYMLLSTRPGPLRSSKVAHPKLLIAKERT